MMSLTTTQRDLLQLLLLADAPMGAAALGQKLHLSPRQVQYGLREVKDWLDRHHVRLHHTPGIGVQIIGTLERKQRLLAELASQFRFQLILTPEQRQQLLALQLLVTREPLILSQFQDDLMVARATVLKDLDAIEPWLQHFQLTIMRRQHRGCWIEGSEFAKRQALIALLWGDVPYEQPIMTHHLDGIVFVLAQDAALLPLIGQINELMRAWDLQAGQSYVTLAEMELNGRFTDEAMLPMALAVALQIQRVHAGQWVEWDQETLRWIQAQQVWSVAMSIGQRLWPNLPEKARTAEIAAFALQLLGSARDEPWRTHTGVDTTFPGLIDTLMRQIASAYATHDLAHDQLLRDGLEALMLPAYVRQRFGLWTPIKPADTQAERNGVERRIAAQLATTVDTATGVALPPDTLDELILLLRAAVLRTHTERFRHIFVVCPSGIATTQLLIARLKSRFPRLGTFEVLPMRELTTARIAEADLIITTVPLALSDATPIDVIQVHPMLKPEDIAALIHWMS